MVILVRERGGGGSAGGRLEGDGGVEEGGNKRIPLKKEGRSRGV